MSASSFPHFPDELLSAYLDDAVSADERESIELALQGNAELAWRLETLRQTVLLLRALPAVQSRRTFSLEAILAAERAAHQEQLPAGHEDATLDGKHTLPPLMPTGDAGKMSGAQPKSASWWDRLGGFFNSGSPLLRNAAMGVAALFVAVAIGSTFDGRSGASLSMENAAPAAESIALMSAPAEAPQAEQQTAAASESALARQQLKSGEEDAEGVSAQAVLAEEAPAEEVPAEQTTSDEGAETAPVAAPALEQAESAAVADSATEAEIASDAPAGQEAALAAEAVAEPPAMRPDQSAAGGAGFPPAANAPGGGGMGGALEPQPLDAPAQGPDSTGLDEALRESLAMAAPSVASASPTATMLPAPAAAAESALDAGAESAAAESIAAESIAAESIAADNTPAETVAADTATESAASATVTTDSEDAAALHAPAESSSGNAAFAAVSENATADADATVSSAALSRESATESLLAYSSTAGAIGATAQATPESIAFGNAESSAAGAGEQGASLAVQPAAARPPAVASVAQVGIGVNPWLLAQIALGAVAVVLFLLWWRSRKA